MAAAILAGAFYWVSRGDRVCDKAAKQLRAASSFQVDIRQGSEHRTISVHCPGRFRIVAQTSAGSLETVVIGNARYSRVQNGRWITVPAALVNLPSVSLCPTTPSEDKDIATLLEKLGDGTRIESLGTRSINGRDCQVWRAVPRGPRPDPSSGPKVDVCIEPASGNISEMVVEDMTWTFTHWNAAERVDEPKLDVATK